MPTTAEIQTHLLLKVADDAAFRERMISDPKGAIEAETAAALPEDILTFVNQVIADAQGQDKPSDEGPLTKEELAQVIGIQRPAHCDDEVEYEWGNTCRVGY